ncbi:hypothetical protein [Halomonas sp. 59]|jgi:type IV secretory pathway TraG/TraD family ATPase VirD4|uniref:hypothetical protein n=1 Tax=unclassified Halomonas TaxID=2609666 RepID=UPI0012F22DF2|nr:hypothetical protein HALOI3_20210 [Halomonas sp. I3]CAD5275358.1 hypothetical protein HALO113_40211 [Halomonas sp. 113]CAD5276551.1 hypothetical protein HALO156_170047 [Halomonas sp. 156]CAD5277103.1 hypothetical protein HALO59_40061 [Halomonas sp. 59]VXC00050.1 hypothetical protein HALO98_40209 [Halomonas titanicae]
MHSQGVLFGQVTAIFGIVIVGVWGATQWTAAALGYQLRLGSPWFDLFGTPVYHPWRLFDWWFFFGAYAPEIFDIGGAIAGSSGLVAVIRIDFHHAAHAIEKLGTPMGMKIEEGAGAVVSNDGHYGPCHMIHI